MNKPLNLTNWDRVRKFINSKYLRIFTRQEMINSLPGIKISTLDGYRLRLCHVCILQTIDRGKYSVSQKIPNELTPAMLFDLIYEQKSQKWIQWFIPIEDRVKNHLKKRQMRPKMKNYEEISTEIIKTICQAGKKAYLVGGAIRDEFLDIEAHDYDIVTDALPAELLDMFPSRKTKMVGKNFLVTLIDDIEVSTYRSDTNVGPGRFNCVTSPCKTLEEDLSRRDFTFNALAVCPYTGEVIDPFDGRKHIEQRLVKFVGDPNQRIYEDYIRMLRGARFACLIEGRLDSDAFNAIRNNRHYITAVSPERVRLELMKVLTYKTPSIFFDILHDTGILRIILPELDVMYGHPGGKYHNETLDTHFKICGDHLSRKDPILRLTGYLHDIGKPVAFKQNEDNSFVDHDKIGYDMALDICFRYKFSIKETERIAGLIKRHMRSVDSLTTNKAIRKFLKVLYESNLSWKDWLKLKIADNKANLGKPDYTREEIRKIVLHIHNCQKESTSGGFNVTDLHINGNDIMKLLNIKPGPQVGQILNSLLERVIEDPSLNNKENLVELAKGECLIG